MLKKILIAALMGLPGLVIPLVSTLEAATREASSLTAAERVELLASFDQVWTTIRDKHWEARPAGLDWPAVRDELRPKVESASSLTEARGAMFEMIDRLGQSHFSIIPSFVYEEMGLPDGEGSRDGSTGIDVRAIAGSSVVVSVAERSPAAQAGVMPGWTVSRVGDTDVSARLERLASEFEGSLYRDAVLAASVLGPLSGPVGTDVEVLFLDGERRAVHLDLKLAAAEGRKASVGFLPPFHVWIRTSRLEGNIGYVRFNMFLDPPRLMPVFNEAMQSFMDADGIIVDLRGNPGGLPGMAMGMAGWLVSGKQERLGIMSMRDLEINVVVFPRATTYAGPVAVLVDGLSGSASELFSGGLQGLGRAHVVGSRTMGAVLPSTIEKLPDGDGFQYAFANFVSSGGDVLEGRGVVPDLEVRPTREALLDGRDPALEAAVDWIRNNPDRIESQAKESDR